MVVVKLTDDIVCTKADVVNEFLKTTILKDGTTLESLSKNIEKVFYVSKHFDVSDKPSNHVAFVRFKRKINGEPLLLFTKWSSKNNYFDGFWIGDFSHITKGFENTYDGISTNKYEAYSVVEKIVTGTIETPAEKAAKAEKVAGDTIKSAAGDIAESIYSRLLINNWKSVDGLARFIKIIGARVIELKQNGVTDFFIENSQKYIVVNTGLLDCYKTDIYIMYQYNLKDKLYYAFKVLKQKQDWIDNGFTREQIKTLPPIKFYNANDMLTNIAMEDIDISTDTYNHIMIDNKERVASVVGDSYNTEILADRIRSAIELGVKMLERDPGYVKPYYTCPTKLSWVIPLHINNSLNEDPEFVLVIAKRGEFYVLKTLLPYNDEVKDYLTAVALYGSKW